MLIGQIILVQPFLKIFGPQSAAFSAFGAVSAIGAVLASYVLARQFLSPRRAALATVPLLIFPGYLAYATSFMTDVPTLALEMTCLALRRRRSASPPGPDPLVGGFRGGWMSRVLDPRVRDRGAGGCAPGRYLRTASASSDVGDSYVGVAACCALLVVAEVDASRAGSWLTHTVTSAPASIFHSSSRHSRAYRCRSCPQSIVAALSRAPEPGDAADMVIGAELGVVVVAYQLFEWYQNRHRSPSSCWLAWRTSGVSPDRPCSSVRRPLLVWRSRLGSS